MSDWTSTIASERMTLDQEFADRVAASSLTNQQWGLVMTATEFEIENPSEPESARLVPDTSNLGAIMDEIENVGRGPVAGGGGGSGSDQPGGLLDSVKRAVGIGSDGDEALQDEAEELASEYARQLQEKLEANGRWESVCELATVDEE